MALDDVLRRIEGLEEDLSSDEVIQEEVIQQEYEWEETGWGHSMTTWDYAAGDAHVPRKDVIVQERITKRGEANGALTQILYNSEFEKARYSAGKALGYSDEKIWKIEHREEIEAKEKEARNRKIRIAVGLTAAVGTASYVVYAVSEYLSK